MLFTIKALCLFVPTFIVIYVTGTVLVTAALGVQGGMPGLVLSRDLAGVPILYYAFITALPIGLLASLAVWALATLFAAVGRKHKSFAAWLAFMALLGAAAGSLAAVLLLALWGHEIMEQGTRRAVAQCLCFLAISGAFACALLSPLWFFGYSRHLSP